MELSGSYLIFLVSISVFGGHLPGVFTILTILIVFSAIAYSQSLLIAKCKSKNSPKLRRPFCYHLTLL